MPRGGPQPRNTLARTPGCAGQIRKTQITEKRGGSELNPLKLEISRGQNVDVITHEHDTLQDFHNPPTKRQKVNHQSSHSSSPMLVEDVLKHLSPGRVSFIPSSSKSQMKPTYGSFGPDSELDKKRNGSLSGLSEHRNVERIMDSSNRRKTYKASSRIDHQYGNSEGLSSQGSSMSSNELSIVGSVGETVTASRPPPGPYHSSNETEGNSRSSLTVYKANSSPPIKNFPIDNPSPYFDPSFVATLPKFKSVRHIQAPPCDSLHKVRRKSSKLADQFITTDGSRRCSDMHLSSEADELQQLGTTVRQHADEKTMKSIQRPTIKSMSKKLQSDADIGSPVENLDSDPGMIKPTQFTGTKITNVHNLRLNGSQPRESKPPWAIGVAAASIAGQLVRRGVMGFVYDEPSATYSLVGEGEHLPLQVRTQKLQKMTWSTSSCKVRFEMSKTEGEDHIVDLIFSKELDISRLLTRLQDQAKFKVTTIGRYVWAAVNHELSIDGYFSDHMDKIFEKRRSEVEKNLPYVQRSYARPNPIQQDDTHRQRWVTKDEAKSAQKDPPQRQSPNRIVDDLVARASLKDDISIERNTAVTDPQEVYDRHDVDSILERLKPTHNDHLRRSSRATNGFRKPPTDLSDKEDSTLDENRYSKIHGLGEPWKRPLTYPKIGKKKTTVDWADLERLDEGEFLNDNLISFYLRYLEHTLEKERPDLAKRIYFFNTFFFATLMNTHKGKKGFNYEGVQKWTRNVDLFTYDYIVVPINESTHWYLAIICNLPVLDRDLDLSDTVPSSPVQHFQTISGQKGRMPPSSPSIKGSGHGSDPSLDDAGECEEREARDSFAEMSLEHHMEGISSRDNDRIEHVPTNAMLPADEDQEMLDGQINDNLTDFQSATEIKLKHDDKASKEAKDAIGAPKSAAKAKKAKRKSMPPVTKVDPNKPAIVTFDSLGLPRSPTIKILKDYLREEAKVKRGGMEFDAGQIKGITASMIPQQENFYDCGVFLLGYVAKFLENDPKDFIANIIGRKYDAEKDWPNLKPSRLRNSIREQVQKLHSDQKIDRQKERSAQKVSNHGVNASHTEASPTRKSKQDKRTSHEHGGKIEGKAQAHDEPPAFAQQQSRKQALDAASSIEPRKPDEKAPEIDPVIGDRGANPVTAHKESDEQPESTKPHTEGPSIISLDSQSQQDFLNIHSHTGEPYNINAKQPVELPDEIEDSQPSQNSKSLAKIMARESEEKETAKALDEAEKASIPIVRLEAQGSSKRKQAEHEQSLITPQMKKNAVEVSAPKPDQVYSKIPDHRDQGKQRSKRRKTEKKKPIKQEEVINIDDD